MTTPLATSPDDAVADLVLVRMALPNPTLRKIREDIGKLLNLELAATEFDELSSNLESTGFLTKGKGNSVALTPAGHERALRFLGVVELPPRLTWSMVISKYLFPQAAGLSANAAAKLDSADKLAAFILKRKYGLADAAGSTVNQVLESVACRELGFPDETTLNGVLRAVLSKLMGSDERLSKEKIAKQLPLFKTGLKAASADAARRNVVRSSLRGAPNSVPVAVPRSDESFDLPRFANSVLKLADDSPSQDRFYDNKVFIAAVWRSSQKIIDFPRLSLSDFKQRLVESNARNLLHLSRADLIQAMDAKLVADSETEYLNATFHFVLLEGKRP